MLVPPGKVLGFVGEWQTYLLSSSPRDTNSPFFLLLGQAHDLWPMLFLIS